MAVVYSLSAISSAHRPPGLRTPPRLRNQFPCRTVELCRPSVRVRTRGARGAVKVHSLHADYAAKATDNEVLKKPLKSELSAHEVRNVFGFPRNLRDKYSVGDVLGAGSFGVVRTCTGTRAVWCSGGAACFLLVFCSLPARFLLVGFGDSLRLVSACLCVFSCREVFWEEICREVDPQDAEEP